MTSHPRSDSSVAETEFVNERGNEIAIFIQGVSDGQTLIRIVGPSSVGEEQITHREAAELYEVLGRYLRSMGGPSQCDGREGMPLRASVQDGNLVVSIGIRTLAFAFENGESNNPYDESSGEFKRQLQIADPLQFAEDVCHEINDEDEDGSTPLTRFLDSMMEMAVENGSLGILDPEDEIPHATNPDGEPGNRAKTTPESE